MNWRSARTATKGILRNPIARFLAATVGSAAILIAALAPLASVLVEGWALQDVESRARLVFRSVRDQVASGLAATPGVDLTPYFNRLAEDERILALGYCTREGKLEFATKLLPRTIDCKQFARAATDTSKVVSQDGHRIHVAVFPLS
ncbi:MAG: trehalose-6-phosphate synthase, partial [Rhodoblastus sp.]|nr:trehalose-6-phosphate synthase [Rhodoblastus sp.]